jgi:hypothetical protein
MSHIIVDPNTVVFHVKGVAAPNDSPDEFAYPLQPVEEERILTITNRHSHDSIVFAVRTNAPQQFVVRNKEGMLPPKASTKVSVSLRRSARRAQPIAKCRFLVQYAIYVDVPDSSNSSQSTGVLEAEERLRQAAVRLGKEWRGRNIDLYDSGSVVVPCILTTEPCADCPAEDAEWRALRADLRRQLAVKEATLRALATKRKALTQLVTQAEEALALAKQRVEVEAKAWRWPWSVKGGSFGERSMELIAIAIFICTTFLLAIQLRVLM